MQISRKILLVAGLCLILPGVNRVRAEEVVLDSQESVISEAEIDEEVTAEDLGIKEPQMLPNNRFYFLKNWGRSIRNILALSPEEKLQLKEQFSNERLIELKKMIKEGATEEEIQKAIESYKAEIENIRNTAEGIKDKAENNEEIDKFLDKFIQQQTLHQRLLEKLENQVGAENFERIKEARERHLENFGEVMSKLENKERLQERIENNLQNMEGSKFKNFKNLEILNALEDKVPEAAKEAIIKAQSNALKRLKGDIENMSLEDQEKFKEYIQDISGDKEAQIQIIENLKQELKNKPVINQGLQQIRERLVEKIRVANTAQNQDCPLISRPAAGFCANGKIIIEKDDQGCPKEIKCVTPEDLKCQVNVTCTEGFYPFNTGLKDAQNCPVIECRERKAGITPAQENPVCTTQWDPVCGKNGKTYSNACLAKAAGTEVTSKGACRAGVINNNPDMNCRNLWWFDNQSRECQQKDFCGAHMYLGLRTFATEDECQERLRANLQSAQ